MEAIANTILKYDGCIWGPWAWYRLGGGQEPTVIHARFVSRSIFLETTLPHQFLIDLKQNFKGISVKGRQIKIGDFTVFVDIHAPSDELKFMEETDYTCNLVDITRTGIVLRHVPRIIMYDLNPFETVMEHIKERKLVPVCFKTAVQNYNKMDQWSSDSFICHGDAEICGICHAEMNACVFTPCNHRFHVECLSKWLEKSSTCPMCREVTA